MDDLGRRVGRLRINYDVLPENRREAHREYNRAVRQTLADDARIDRDSARIIEEYGQPLFVASIATNFSSDTLHLNSFLDDLAQRSVALDAVQSELTLLRARSVRTPELDDRQIRVTSDVGWVQYLQWRLTRGDRGFFVYTILRRTNDDFPVSVVTAKLESAYRRVVIDFIACQSVEMENVRPVLSGLFARLEQWVSDEQPRPIDRIVMDRRDMIIRHEKHTGFTELPRRAWTAMGFQVDLSTMFSDTLTILIHQPRLLADDYPPSEPEMKGNTDNDEEKFKDGENGEAIKRQRTRGRRPPP